MITVTPPVGGAAILRLRGETVGAPTENPAGAPEQGRHDAVDERQYGLQAAADEAIFDRAADEDRIVVSD